MTDPKQLYGVIGWPLAQTLSPLIHNIAFQEYHLPAVYMAWPVPPEKLKIFLEALQAYRVYGCSVTIPHKLAVMPYLSKISETAALASAVNTLYFEEGKLCGENTDVTGFLAPLLRDRHQFESALLLGAGGAAHAVCAGLKMLGCTNVFITSQSNERQFQLARQFSYKAIPWNDRYDVAAQLVINSTPLGMKGKFMAESAYDFARAPKTADGVAYDLVYNPVETKFLREAREAGRNCIDGMEMFFAQANAQFKLWTGKNLPEASRAALKETLGQ